MEQGRVEFDSGLFQYTGPEQPRVKINSQFALHWLSIGIQLVVNWHSIGILLKVNWYSIFIPLTLHW